MKNTSGLKIKKIIENNFDARMTMAVITYIIEEGWNNVKEITDDQIMQLKGTALMTDKFVQALVRTAKIICNDCSMIDDFLPFIIMELHVPNAPMGDLDLYKEDFEKWEWNEILKNLDLDEEEDADGIERVDVRAVVLRTN